VSWGALAFSHRHDPLPGYLTGDDTDGGLMDVHGEALRRLGVESSAQYVIRPDGKRFAEATVSGRDPIK
jgi:hypothetical protein